jgi:predicted permease
MIRALRRTWNRLLGSLVRHRSDEGFSEEVSSHIQLMVDDEVRHGVPRDEAHRRARLRFGSVESAKESYLDQRRLPILEIILQDLRYAARGMRRNPGFATVAILSLAIGIGANTAIFSLVNGVLLQPLAFRDPDSVFAVREVTSNGRALVNPVHARAWAVECPSIEELVLMRDARAELTTGGEPLAIRTVNVTHNLFTLFGIDPVLGRSFRADEEVAGNSRVVILDEPFWRARFNADPSIVGQNIIVDGEPNHVVGIVPAVFRLPFQQGADVRFEIYRPLVLSAEELARVNGNFNYNAVIRVRPGVTAEQALNGINAVQLQFRRSTGLSVNLRAMLTPAHELITGDLRLGLWMLAAAVGAVLLIVCVNLANLLLSRMASRGREAAIRTALGASRARQFGQVLTESLLLSVSGGILGVFLAGWTLTLLVGVTTIDIPRLNEVSLDSNVFVFAFLLTVVAGLLFGVLPAWRFTRHDPQAALRAGSHTTTEARGGLRLRKALIALEVGLSAALLIVAGLLGTSLTRLLIVDKGFDASHVLTTNLNITSSRYVDPIVRTQFFDRLLATVDAIPGVVASGLVTSLPTQGQSWNDPIYLEGAPRDNWHPVNNRFTSPGYFRTMNIRVLHGRAFDERDRAQGVAVLSEKAARLLWPDDPAPVGRLFMGEDDKIKTLVGIVDEVRAELESDPQAHAYYPYWQRVPDGAALVVRTAGDASSVTAAVRASLRSQDAQLPIPPIRAMEDVVDESVARRRFQSMLMTAFAASALLVASLGIYGVVSYSVAQRRNEIGIRTALGARRAQVLGLIVRQGMMPVVIGLAAGVTAALLLSQTIRGLLFEVQPSDPVTIVGVSVTLLCVGVFACLIPARRAASGDAVAALRIE